MRTARQAASSASGRVPFRLIESGRRSASTFVRAAGVLEAHDFQDESTTIAESSAMRTLQSTVRVSRPHGSLYIDSERVNSVYRARDILLLSHPAAAAAACISRLERTGTCTRTRAVSRALLSSTRARGPSDTAALAESKHGSKAAAAAAGRNADLNRIANEARTLP